MPLDGLYRVPCSMCAASEDTSINPTGYRTTACEILDEQSFEFTLCHATTLRHYALAVLTLGYLRQVSELARWWPSQLVLGWNVDRPVICCACGHLLDDRRRITFCFQLTICSPVVSLGFQRVNLPAFTIESDKPEIVRASFKISATFQMPSAFSRPDGTVISGIRFVIPVLVKPAIKAGQPQS